MNELAPRREDGRDILADKKWPSLQRCVAPWQTLAQGTFGTSDGLAVAACQTLALLSRTRAAQQYDGLGGVEDDDDEVGGADRLRFERTRRRQATHSDGVRGHRPQRPPHGRQRPTHSNGVRGHRPQRPTHGRHAAHTLTAYPRDLSP